MDNGEKAPATQEKETPERKGHHLIHPKWLRITLKTLMWIIIAILLIPVLIYVPPVQTLVKNVACKVVSNSTGMKVEIDRFRIKWPMDVSLNGVSVVEATGDTMVNAREVIADVKLLPLLRLDVKVNRLSLLEGYYRMVSPDSSMIMQLRLGELTVDDQSSADIAGSRINLHKGFLKDGKVSLYMDVWRQKPVPTDSTSVPFYIKADDLQLANFTFEMSMLPTIDTLVLHTNDLRLRKGVIDLGRNLVTAQYLGASGGDVTYLTPTPEYIASHPAPPPSDPQSPPMEIRGDTVELKGFEALYAVKGAEPLQGFDPSYIEVSNIGIEIQNFINKGASIELPVKSLTGTERSGLTVTQGNGTLGVDSIGLSLKSLNITTPYSAISATADIPYALMELNPDASLEVNAEGSIGLPDVEAFMPDMKPYTSLLPQRMPLEFEINALGTLSDADIPVLSASMPGVMTISAEGVAKDPLDYKKMVADLSFSGSVTRPEVLNKLMGKSGIKLPALRLRGKATAAAQNYGIDFNLLTSAGDMAAKGRVGMTSERYSADVKVKEMNVAYFLPEMGVGRVTATLLANGAGFNPEKPHAHTDIKLDIASLEYQKHILRDIVADVRLQDGKFNINGVSNNAAADFYIKGDGSISTDLYVFDLTGGLNHIDLQALGISPEKNEGSGIIRITGKASPAAWNYDVDMSVDNLNWIAGEQKFRVPGSIDASFKADEVSVRASADALLTRLDLGSPVGLKTLISGLTTTSDTLARQMKNKLIDIENLQKAMPPFELRFTASGRGAVGRVLNDMGMSVDTVQFALQNDSLIYGNALVRNISNGTMRADTITFNLSQRAKLLDYKLHMGNRPNNPIAEFADVNLNGYVGSNRVLLSVTQKNQKGKTGYRLGMTGAYLDSVVSVHFTPLKATIAYLPWTFNADNHVEYNIVNHHVDANLKANSNESGILLQTQVGNNGNDELKVRLDNIHIQDFLQLSIMAPPLTASVNADLNVGYAKSWIYGGGSVEVSDFTYDRQRVGDFNLGLRAGRNNDGTTAAIGTLKIDNEDALTAKVRLAPDSTGVLETERFNVDLTRFPLRIANAFLGRDVAALSGYLNGKVDIKGKVTAPMVNGHLGMDSVGVYIPMIGSSIRLSEDSVYVADNVVTFKNFDIWGANKNPLVIDGTVDARKMSRILFNLGVNGTNVQLIGNDKNTRSDIFGKLFINMTGKVTGSMQAMNINTDLRILKATDLTYSVSETTAQLNQLQDVSGIVKFVDFNDTTQIVKEDTVAPLMAMRITAGVTIEPGTRVTVDIPGSAVTGSGRVNIEPEGTLNYFQNYMGDMRLNGKLNLTGGTIRYGVAMGAVKADFTLDPSSYINWSGDIMNPILKIGATDVVKTSLVENGNSRLVNFNVQLNVTNTLSAPKVIFDLSTNEDMSVENDLLSMSQDQRSMAAINLLLTGQYSAGGVKTASSDLLQDAQGALYGMLTSQLNNFLANHVKGVDLSIGVDQYDKTVNGETGTATNYSYTMSKSLFDNRFKISVGGNYTTDASADENFSENLISDIAFEYILRQTNNISMYARLFRHTGYESILEGEITEMGAGFVMKRRLETLKNLFNFKRGKRWRTTVTEKSDSVKTEQNDSIK